MNVEGFVKWINAGSFEQPSAGIVRVCKEVSGFSAPYLAAILSKAVSYMDEDEIYLEIGSLFGRTLIGTLIDNPDAKAVAVDNFCKFNGSFEALDANLSKFKVREQIRFYEMSDDEFFESVMPDIEERIGVYFYDGDHNTDAGFRNLCAVTPYLPEEAIIIMDDFSSHGVWRSVQAFMNEYPRETALVFCMRTNNFPHGDARWWNGIVVIHWKPGRSPATGV